MTSTYVNDLRLNEMATGDASGSWGTVTNTNLELIGEALGFGTEATFNTDENKITTVLDGASDPARAMYFKVTSTVSGGLTATRQLRIDPDTISRLMFIENATTGGESITIKQGSGAGAAVTIPNGQTKAVILPGSGSGSIVLDAFASLSVVDLLVDDDLTVTDDMTVGGTLGVTGVLTATSLDISGDIDVDGTTNLDVVDIDGAVNIATTALVTGVLTTTAATVSNGGGQFNGAINVGVDGTGYDVKFFGDTASAFMLWDQSGDDLILGGAAQLGIGNGTTAPTATLDVRRSDADGKIAEFHQSGGFGLEFGSSQAQAYIEAGSGQTLLMTIPSHITIDAEGDIILDSNAANWRFKDNGTSILEIGSVSSGPGFYSAVSNAAMLFKGNDGGSPITALTLDMSEAGAATFNTNVGIGGDPVPSATNYNGAALHIRQAGSSSVGSQIHLTTGVSGHAAGDGSFIAQWSDLNLYITNQESADIVFSSGGNSNALIIDSNADVGIGVAPTTTYGKVLQVHDTGTSGASLRLTDSNSAAGTGNGGELLQLNTAMYLMNREDGIMVFSTDDLPRMTIDSSGRVLMGTATDSNAHANADDLIIGNVPASGENRGITIVSGTDANGAVHFSDGTSSGSANIQGQFVYDHSNSKYLFYVAAEERLSLDYNLDIKNGNLIVAADHGVYFGAATGHTKSVSSNLLSDYEEGEWNPVLKDSSANAVITLDQAYGFYTKIGRQVYVNGQVNRNDATSYTATLLFTALPFTSGNGTGSLAFNGGFWVDTASATDPIAMAYIDKGTTTAYLKTINQSAAYISSNQMENGRPIYFSFTYIAA